MLGLWQRLSSGLGPDTRLYFHLLRRPARAVRATAGGGSNVASVSARKRQAFLAGRVQRLDAYLVWCHDPGLRPVGARFRTGAAIAARPPAETRRREDGDNLPRLGGRGGGGPVPGDDRRGPLAGGRTHARRDAGSGRGFPGAVEAGQPSRHALARRDGQRDELAARGVGTGGRAFAPEVGGYEAGGADRARSAPGSRTCMH